MPDSMGHLTREEMEAVIDRNESVIHNGVHISNKAMLPTEVDLAVDSIHQGMGILPGDALSVDDIDEQIAALEEHKKRLQEAMSEANKSKEAKAAAKQDEANQNAAEQADEAQAKADAKAAGQKP